MKLGLLRLESRDCPSVYDMGHGVLHISTGHEDRVFPDWHGGLNFLQAADGLVWVGPTDGGGEVVAVLHPDGSRDRPDFFAGPPTARGGVVFVDTGGTITQAPSPPVPQSPVPAPLAAAAPTFVVPDLTRGNPNDPKTFRVFLDFENPDSTQDVTGTVDEIWRVEQPLGNVALVTRRPDDWPGYYGTVVIGAGLHYTDAWGDTSETWYMTHNTSENAGVYVDSSYSEGQPDHAMLTGNVAAHEIGHALGLLHDATPGSVMNPDRVFRGSTYTPADVALARDGAAKAVALADFDRHVSAAAGGIATTPE